MKRLGNILAIFVVFLTCLVLQAQSPAAQNPAQQDLQRNELFKSLYETHQAYQRQVQAGGGRGAAAGGRGGGTSLSVWPGVGAAWWTNTALVTKLGLTDDQKSKIEKAYESHRDGLTTKTYQLGLQEGRLALMLSADPVDRKAVQSQIDLVVQARGELERANSTMTLEMREVLTAAQWALLQQQPVWLNGTEGTPRTFRFYGTPAFTGQRNSGQRQQ